VERKTGRHERVRVRPEEATIVLGALVGLDYAGAWAARCLKPEIDHLRAEGSSARLRLAAAEFSGGAQGAQLNSAHTTCELER
jgi:hypothetical protein